MRLLMYSPDSYGLGHVRRSTLVARAILNRGGGRSVLLLTGAPRAHLFDYPAGCRFVKLPSITKNSDGCYISRDPDLELEEAVTRRERMIRFAADRYCPDVLLVDHNPLGLCGEILPTLRRLATGRRRAVRILGMRDVIDDAAAVRAAWERDDVLDILDEHYDLIFVYGERRIYDPVRAYGIPDRIARKISFVGYISRDDRRADPRVLKERFAPRTGQLVVVTLGGGGDGNLVLRSFLEGFERLGPNPPFEVVAITGPLMSPGKRERFLARAGKLPGVTMLEYTAQVPDLVEAADYTVSMGGYNTVCELACAGARSTIVPRTFPRREQLIRAQFLAGRGVADCLIGKPDPAVPDPDELLSRVQEGLGRPWPKRGW